MLLLIPLVARRLLVGFSQLGLPEYLRLDLILDPLVCSIALIARLVRGPSRKRRKAPKQRWR